MIPFMRCGGYSLLRRLSSEGVEYVWWRWWPYCFQYVDSLDDSLRRREHLKSDVFLLLDASSVKEEPRKILQWEYNNGIGLISSNWIRQGGGIKKICKVLPDEGLNRIAICIDYISNQQFANEINLYKDIIERSGFLAIRSSFFWGLLYGSMAYHSLIGDFIKDLILIGPVEIGLIPVISYLDSIWPGNVYFLYDICGTDEFWVSATRSFHPLNCKGDGEVDLPCICPFCSGIKGRSFDRVKLRYTVWFHNLYSALNEWISWRWVVRDRAEFIQVVKKYGLYVYVDYINSSSEWGWERASKIIWHHFHFPEDVNKSGGINK